MDCKIAGDGEGHHRFSTGPEAAGQFSHELMAETVETRPGWRGCLSWARWPRRWRKPRKELSKYAPRIVTVKINPEKIGALIGPGGKNIKRLVEESGLRKSTSRTTER